MYLLGLGLVLLALKYFSVGPVGAWAWWQVLLPFGLAVLWWAWADASGYTRRKVMEQEDRRRQERIDRTHETLGQKRRH